MACPVAIEHEQVLTLLASATTDDEAEAALTNLERLGFLNELSVVHMLAHAMLERRRPGAGAVCERLAAASGGAFPALCCGVHAVLSDDPRLLQVVLDRFGVPAGARDTNGLTLLNMACRNGCFAAAACLVGRYRLCPLQGVTDTAIWLLDLADSHAGAEAFLRRWVCDHAGSWPLVADLLAPVLPHVCDARYDALEEVFESATCFARPGWLTPRVLDASLAAQAAATTLLLCLKRSRLRALPDELVLHILLFLQLEDVRQLLPPPLPFHPHHEDLLGPIIGGWDTSSTVLHRFLCSF